MPMSADFIPGPDLEFDAYIANMLDIITANPADYNLPAGYVATLTAAKTAWDAAFGPFQAARNAFHAATQTKDGARGGGEAAIRAINNFLQATGFASDAAKEAAGLPVRDTNPTPAQVPATAPFVSRVEVRGAGELIVHFRDQLTPDSRAKPPGVREAEIWAKVDGPAPLNGSGCVYMGSS